METLYGDKRRKILLNIVGLRKIMRIQKEFEMKLGTEAKTNPKAVWKYMNSKTKNQEGVSDLNTDPKSRAIDSDREKVVVLGHFFQVF